MTPLCSSHGVGVLALTVPPSHVHGSTTRAERSGDSPSLLHSVSPAQPHPAQPRNAAGAPFLATRRSCPKGKCPERRGQLPPLPWPWPWPSQGALPPPPSWPADHVRGQGDDTPWATTPTTQLPRPEGPAVWSCHGPRCSLRCSDARTLLGAGRQVPRLCEEQVRFLLAQHGRAVVTVTANTRKHQACRARGQRDTLPGRRPVEATTAGGLTAWHASRRRNPSQATSQ